MTADLDQLCTRATAFHNDARTRIAALDARIQASHRDPRLLASWRHFEHDLRHHFDEEEAELFPALRRLAHGDPPPDGPWRTRLDELSRELDEVRTIADALREAARDAGDLETDLLDLLDDLEAHAEAEATVVFPAARARLAPAPEPPAPPALPRPAPADSRLRRLARRLLGRS